MGLIENTDPAKNVPNLGTLDERVDLRRSDL
jgi:hypothetical protein